jgi:hypothetical protein
LPIAARVETAGHPPPAPMPERPSRVALACLLGVVAAMAALTSLVTTRSGVGLSPDSAVYLGTATNLLNGEGLRVPFVTYPRGQVKDPLVTSERLTSFPPVYPALIAGVSRLSGARPEKAARAINALGLAALVAMAGWALHRYSGGSLLMPALGAVLLVSSVDVLLVSTTAWSELLFMVLSVGAILAVTRHLESPSWLALIGCSALAALSVLTRFVGAALVLTLVFSLVALSSHSLRRRLAEAGSVVVVTAVPTALWGAGAIGSGTVGHRPLALHPRLGTSLGGALETVAAWLVQEREPRELWASRAARALNPLAELPRPLGAVLVIAALGLVAVAAFGARRPPVAGASLVALPKVLAVFVAAYGLALLVTIWFVDAGVSRLDLRLLSPAHVMGLLALVALAARYVEVSRLSRPAIALAALLVVLFLGQAALAVIGGERFSGQYAREKWRRSPIMGAVRELPADQLVVTNAPGPVWLLAGRSSAAVPERFSLVTRRPNRLLDAELAALGQSMRARGALLVWVDDGPDDSHLPDERELELRLGLQVVRTEADGTVYK